MALVQYVWGYNISSLLDVCMRMHFGDILFDVFSAFAL